MKEENFSDHRNLVSNSFYSFLSIYGNFFFNLIITFLIARLISPDAWSALIIANSYIIIVTLILTFFPPGLQQTLHYFLPRYHSLNENEKLKSLLKTAFITKLVFLFPIFLISLALFYFFPNLFVNLAQENINLLYLLSPLIIINGLDLFLTSVNQGWNNYRVIFLLLVLKNILYIGSMLVYFFITGNLELENIAFFNVIAFGTAFLLNLLYVLRRFFKLKTESKTPLFHNEDFKRILRYGSPVRAGKFLTELWGEIQLQAIGTFFSSYTTGFYLARTYLSVSTNALNSFSSPLTVSFSSLIAKDEKEKIRTMYNLIIKYSSFIFLLLTGILFLCTDFFLYLLGADYLQFAIVINIYLFSYLFLGFAAPFDALMLAENKSKYVLYIRVLGFLLRLPLFLILLSFLGLIPALIGIIISNTVFGIIYLMFTIKLGNIKIELRRLITLYAIFFLSLVIVVLLKIFFLDIVESNILNFLNLSLLQNFYPISLVIYFIIFLVLNISLKTIRTEDIENLRTVFHSESIFHKILSKILGLFKKFSRK